MMKRKKKGWLDLRSFRGNFRRLWVVLRNDILVLAKTESVRASATRAPCNNMGADFAQQMGDTYGFIRLEGCEVRRLTDGFGEKRSFVFEIYLPTKRSIYTFKSA